MTTTYSGTTAGATSANPPILISNPQAGTIANAPGSKGAKLWFYTSTNAATDVALNANTFTDGKVLGMAEGDVLIGVYSTSAGSTVQFMYMGVLTAVTTSGVGMSSAFISSTAT